jgi:phospholipid/cholesterol/gamma-HCH transport system substrate-binding protein
MQPSKHSWANLKVGIVAFIGLAMFVFLVSIVGNDQNVFTKTYTLKIFIPNVQDLVNGSEVTLGGLKIGFVRQMNFTQKDGVNGVDVLMQVETKYQASITTSSLAQIKTIGLLGDKYIDLKIGSPGETPLADGAYVNLQESFDLETAGPQFKSALADFTALMASMRHIAGSIERGEGTAGRLITKNDFGDQMEHFLNSLNSTMSAVEHKQGTLGSLIYDPTISKNINEVAVNLKDVTSQINSGKGTVGKLVMDDKLYNNLASFSSRADSLMARVNSDSSNVSKLITDPTFFKNVNGVLNDLNLLLIDIKQHPDRYVHVSVF